MITEVGTSKHLLMSWFSFLAAYELKRFIDLKNFIHAVNIQMLTRTIKKHP